MIERLAATRYVTPLREGGSLPAVVDTDAGGTFVVKFLGAGQGAKALVAEALVAELGVALGLPIPKPAIVDVADGFGAGEPDPEIQDLLRASVGPNFGLAYLPGAFAFDPAVDGDIAPDLAAEIVWFDAFVMNVDRTPRNTNLLVWNDAIWMIDHGAALYIHHQWVGWEARAQSPFPHIRDHVLLPFAGDRSSRSGEALLAADRRLRSRLTSDDIRAAVSAIPDEWLVAETFFPDLAAHRAAYATYLEERLRGSRRWLQEAIDARERGPVPYAPRLTRRVV